MLIRVKVRPDSREQKVERISDELFSEKGIDGLYFVKVKARADQGKANLELLKILEKYFGAEVKIKSGFTSINKIVEVFK
jgi:uncharacterized protein (TIGR00251 family)